ncbi:hypothetical protein GCM10027425_32890 [Alteromonas gracilis]
MTAPATRPVLVTGANGLVGSYVVAELVSRGVPVRALVRRPGTAPEAPGVEEVVGDFTDPGTASSVVEDVAAVLTLAHPMAAEAGEQERVAVTGTAGLVEAAVGAGVRRAVHLSTAGVYDRTAGVGDVAEDAALVGDDASAYAVAKLRTDDALSRIAGVTGVLVRPPAILGVSDASVWNVRRPEDIRRDDPAARRHPEATFAWVHARDLAVLLADLVLGDIAEAEDAEAGPVAGVWTPVNAAAPPARWRDYHGTVGEALGVPITWSEEPGWTGCIRTERAARWGWSTSVSLADALTELADGLRGA